MRHLGKVETAGSNPAQGLKNFYRESKGDFETYLLRVRQISEGKKKDYINTLDNYLAENIFTTKDLKSHLPNSLLISFPNTKILIMSLCI